MGKDRGRLPIKTKMAIWWIITTGLLGTIGGIIAFTNHDWEISGEIGDAIASYVVILVVIFLFGFFYVLAGIILAAKTKRAWKVAVAALSLEMAIGSYISYIIIIYFNYYFIAIVFAYLAPLILVIFDKKNYWEMVDNLIASERAAMKKAQSPANEITSHPSTDF